MTEDFWANIETRGGECWPWRGAVTKKRGYGYLSYHGRTKLAHRIVWEQYRGPLLPLERIGWTCRNRGCCNPDHMFKYAHRSHKGEVKTRRGEKYPNAHLTLDRVAEIRRYYATGRITYQHLAKMNGVSAQQIGRIVRNDQWKEESGV